MSSASLEMLKQSIDSIETYKIYGRVTSVKGIILESQGLENNVSIGTKCLIHKDPSQFHQNLMAEVVALTDDKVLLLPYGDLEGVAIGNLVSISSSGNVEYPDSSWLGRVINAFGEPIDDLGPLKKGVKSYPLKTQALNPQKRNRVGEKIDLGIKAIDCFASCCYGQRLGIFAGSGVGKSVLISMITKYANTDVKIIGLIGERGREVQEFIQEYLGEEGLKKAVIIVATGDEPALMRKRAAYLTITIAEYFRDLGLEVMCIMDSVTRIANAQREIGLAAGEPPTTKGYTPSVFSELPKILERAGPGINKGNITGLFTVLVDGDDQNEPISDAVRSILDGHIVLDRSIGERGRYPAVDVLKSVSRAMPKCNNDFENNVVRKAKYFLSIYNDMAEMIRLGAYKKGADPDVDESIRLFHQIENFLSQNPDQYENMGNSFRQLAEILNITPE